MTNPVTDRAAPTDGHPSEADQLRRIVDSVLDGIIGEDLDGTITSWNRGAEKLYGYRAAEIIGRNIDILVPPERKHEVAELTAKIRRGMAIEPFQTEHATKTGTRIDVVLTPLLIRDRTGTLTGTCMIAHEIAERRSAKERLQELRDHIDKIVAARTAEISTVGMKLEAANKELEAFAYSVSHDLRTPLRAIDGFSQILLEDHANKLDAEGKHALNVIRESAAKMSRMIDDILAFSRIGRADMMRASVDMEELVRVAIKDLEPVTAGRQVSFKVGALPKSHGDASMIQHIWANLLDNAVKFTASRPVATIEIGAAAGDGETVYFVRDNGVGFDMQFVDKLFTVFQRLHGAEFPGTGVGLAIVKRIVTRHGGRVWAEGKPNEGATFYFALPERRRNHV